MWVFHSQNVLQKSAARPVLRPGGVRLSRSMQQSLEDDLASQLDNSSGTGLCDLAEVCVAESVAHGALAGAASRGSCGSTPYCVWLKLLNVSSRNWKATLSVNLNILPKPMSQLLIPGCVSVLRPTLP